MNRQDIIACFILYMCASCTGHYTPKPVGYLRIELPEAKYVTFDKPELPYTFALSQWANVEMPPNDTAGLINIDYPEWQAKIYGSYRSLIGHTVHDCTAECRMLVERAAGKAEVIIEKSYANVIHNVYGILFQIEGTTASPVQFILTDSITHFFRGALYYHNTSNADSIAPVTDYLKNDIMALIQTFRWKK